ncbi:hypothetical protein BGZ96_011216 [Linnemannia gamsii]|uniref:DUF221-domain-containing protein n=1 Tax=Linnemannia gamsii TaxID=64522 RepID=A0ABQ7JT16_9FUNG|nr:hypothetical protein BGZ96_011216 [Linnemannia gamsii]
MESAQAYFKSGPMLALFDTDVEVATLAPGRPASTNSTGLKTQLAISTIIGLSSFLAFCFLRTRWTVIFAPRTKLRRHTPPVLKSTFFGWIPELIKIPEAEVLNCVGLDAAMMLRFFEMSFKLFAICLVPGLLIVWPVNSYSTNDGRPPTDTDDDADSDDDPSYPGSLPRPGTHLLYLFTQFTFTWVFSLLTLYSIWRTYEGYIDVRRRYLLKRHRAIVNKTVMVVGLPVHLQSDKALATFYESLGVGTVESAHVCRHVTTLKRLIEQRAHALRRLEITYTRYYGNPSGRSDYDPDALLAENDMPLDDNQVENAQETNRDSMVEVDEGYSLVRASTIKRRPTMRLGFMGLFGRKVDTIEHYQEVFATLDKAVQKLRMSRVYATTSIGFVTFEEMHHAQILAQTVNTQETLSCETFMAPEPRDVYWDNLNLPPSELGVRMIVINVIVFLLVFFWAGPVGVFSSFLNLDSLDRIFPGISKIAGMSPILKSLIQGFLPTVGVIIFLAVVPRILLSLCRQQGLQSHSEIARSLYNKYFTFILFNVVLVFTIVGTWAQAVNNVYHNVGELALLLAQSLPRVAPFFVNYTILRGIGLFPMQLLQLADIVNLAIQKMFSRTPRDYAESRAPPELPYGVVYSNATLAFVVILIYSCIKPMILIFGVIYFAVGYLVFKYQLLYVYFHPNESGGQIWPMVYNRLTLGLVTFQVTMLGLFTLKQAYFFGILLAPLPAGTVWFWYWTTNQYHLTARHIPLELMRPLQSDEDYEDYLEDVQGLGHGQEDQDDYRNNHGSLAALGSEIAPPSSNGLGHITVDMTTKKPATSAAMAPTRLTLGNDITEIRTPSGGVAVITPGGSKRKMPKSVVDEDDYQAIPDRFTDYRQPPMTLYPGVLNSGMRHYQHPAFAGPLPTLWLPLKKGRSGGKGQDSKRKSVLINEEIRVENSDSYVAGILDASQPRTYDEGDNLAGGGQDEDEGEEEEDIVSPSGGSDSIDIRGRSMSVSGAGHGGSGGVMPQEPDAMRAIFVETFITDDDNSSDVTGGPSRPESPTIEAAGHSASQNLENNSALKRNPAVEGISDVYYHHPERRLSSASSTSAIRLAAVASVMGANPNGGPPRSLPVRGSRTSMLGRQSFSQASPPSALQGGQQHQAPSSGLRRS